MNYKILSILFLSLILFQCKKIETKTTVAPIKNEIKYAEGFSIQTFSTYKKLTIHRAYIGDSKQSEYYLFSKNKPIPDSLSHKKIIRIPLEKIVVTNTSHIPMIEAIGVENTLIGFPNTQYISSPITRSLISNGKIKDLGNEQAVNIEILLDIKPDVMIGFGVDKPSKMYEQIENMGISVLMNSDWMEETSLGRAEWIKFFGALYDRDSIANNYFKGIETTYLALITKASYTKSKPSILVGSLFQNVWYAAAGENFLAQMIRDAGGNYLWKETKGNGSLALSIESVLDKAKNADIWIAPGNYESTNSLFEANSIYKEFKPFHTKSIYSYAHLKGKTGGIIYFESSPLHPDWVLEDLIQIFHPDLKLERDLHFFKKIE